MTDHPLKYFCSLSGITGNEVSIANDIENYWKKYGKTEIDRFGNVYLIKEGKKKSSIIVSAHYDEIGGIVIGFEREYVLFQSAGGIDPISLIGNRVIIHTQAGQIEGIVGAIPPHYRSKKEEITVKSLFIDTGLSEKEIKKKVKIGDFIGYYPRIENLSGNVWAGKSIDNRGGLAVITEMFNYLKNTSTYHTVVGVANIREEYGGLGIEVAKHRLKPVMGIVIDATFGKSHYGDKPSFELGKGPAIATGPAMSDKWTKELMKVAKEENISYQIEPIPRRTGTDTDKLQVYEGAIHTLLVSFPLRYMHTHVETVNYDDIKNAGKLLARFITRIEEDITIFERIK